MPTTNYKQWPFHSASRSLLILGASRSNQNLIKTKKCVTLSISVVYIACSTIGFATIMLSLFCYQSFDEEPWKLLHQLQTTICVLICIIWLVRGYRHQLVMFICIAEVLPVVEFYLDDDIRYCRYVQYPRTPCLYSPAVMRKEYG